jgi:hypothetical protein
LWPIQVNPDDIRHAYFRDLDRKWHILTWEHAAGLDMPVSLDARRFGRKLAAASCEFPNDRIAIDKLLERWKLGLGTTRQERRMALRMALEQPTFPTELEEPDEPTALEPPLEELGGDDDEADFETLADAAEFDEAAFYADALEDL